jgi:hypothetical protein
MRAEKRGQADRHTKSEIDVGCIEYYRYWLMVIQARPQEMTDQMKEISIPEMGDW